MALYHIIVMMMQSHFCYSTQFCYVGWDINFSKSFITYSERLDMKDAYSRYKKIVLS